MDPQLAPLDPTDRTRDWCYDDLAAIPDDRNRYEIIDGELIVSPSPIITHQQVSANLHVLLRRALRDPGLAEVLYAPCDVILGPRRVVIPDLVVVRTARAGIITERAIEGVPDLVVEILSPSTAKVDRGRKQRLFGEVGVPEYWLVDPRARTLEVLTAAPDGVMRRVGLFHDADTAHSPTFALTFAMADVFAA